MDCLDELVSMDCLGELESVDNLDELALVDKILVNSILIEKRGAKLSEYESLTPLLHLNLPSPPRHRSQTSQGRRKHPMHGVPSW